MCDAEGPGDVSDSEGGAVTTSSWRRVCCPILRPLVPIDVGVSQMTYTGLSTCIRHGQALIVVVANRGYGTKQEIVEGTLKDTHEWHTRKSVMCWEELLAIG